MDRIWVAKLSISTRTSNKIHSKHGLTDHEVRDAIVCVAGLYERWDEEAVKGVRVLLDARIRDRPVTIVLHAGRIRWGDAWSLGSVYFVD